MDAHHPSSGRGRAWRVVFLVERPESWLNVQRLWSLMETDPRFEPQVRVIPHDDDPTRRMAKRSACVARLRAAAVANVEGEADSPQPLHPGEFDVAIFNSPYDRERDEAFHFDRIAGQVSLTVYIPYGLVMGGGRRNRHYQYGQRTQRDAGLIIARSEAERALYASYRVGAERRVAVTGLPRLDELATLAQFHVDPALREAIDGRFTVLWNSHFSFGRAFADSANFSTFDALVEPLFSLARQRPDIALVWRPHPSLFRVLVNEGFLRADQITAFRAEVAAAGIIVDDRPDHRHAFAASHMLLTDLGSFLVEYLATDKPLVYLHADSGEGLNAEGAALVEHIDIARSAADAVAFVGLYTRGEDPRRHLRQLARERFLPMLDGHAAERVVDRIAMALGVAESADAPGPLTTALFAGMEKLRQEKRRRGSAAPAPRRWLAMLRLEAVEWIKRNPRLLRLTRRGGKP